MNLIQNFFFNQLVNYIDMNPVENSIRFLNTINKLGLYTLQRSKADVIFEQLANPSNQWNGYIRNLQSDLNRNSRRMMIGNLLLRGMLFPKKERDRLREKQQIPAMILLDPTSACNLHCTGCWASDYSKTDSLTFELIERIINEGKEIKVNTYIFSGGEPLIRKKDIIRLCERHRDCYFMAFTNGTLIDEQFASDVARVGNFAPAISIEGFEEMTDFRRGKGTYRKVIDAMMIMRKHGNLFGFSATYHRLNAEMIGSEKFLDSMLALGCRFAWYFTYMPVGSDAREDLIVTPEQRASMFFRLRDYRRSHPIFLMDFWNDGEFTEGCIAGGRQYIHINARGDVEPCAFVHYSNANIKDMSLIEALRQPLFEQYRKNIPFNSNYLQPCPCLDNPEKLRKMVNEAKAVSTHLNGSETVGELTARCEKHAAGWARVACNLCYSEPASGKTRDGISSHDQRLMSIIRESVVAD